MAVGHEDIAAGRPDDIGGLVEEAGARSADAGFAERHQELAIGTEFQRHVALALAAAGIGYPEVALWIDGAAVRKDHHPCPNAASSLPVRSYLRIGASLRPAQELA